MNPQNSKQLSTKKSEKKNISSPLGRKTVKRSEEPYSLYSGSVNTEKWIPLFPLCPLRLCSSLSLSLFLFTTVLSLQCRTSCSSVHLSIIIIIPHSQWGEAVRLVLRFFQWGETISLNFKWLIFCTWEGQKKKKEDILSLITRLKTLVKRVCRLEFNPQCAFFMELNKQWLVFF